MKRVNVFIYCSLVLIFLFLQAGQALSEESIGLTIKTILASGDPGPIDSRLRAIVGELQNVFRYSSYKLLSDNQLRLNQKGSGSIALPENRVMKISSKGISGNRVTLAIEIVRNKKGIFQTVIQLHNKTFVTIGGPGYQGGNLLINIFASF